MLLETLEKHNAFKLGDFTLSSGEKSKYYIDCREALTNSWGLEAIGAAWVDFLGNSLARNVLLCGVPTSGLLMIAGIMARYAKFIELRSVYVRTIDRCHGTKRIVEGAWQKDDVAIIFDDVSTTGHSFIDTYEKLYVADIPVIGACCLVDRSNGATAKKLKQRNVPFGALLTMSDVESHFKEKENVGT